MRLVDLYDVLLLDLDGVVYRGAGAVPFAVVSLAEAVGGGARLGYVTNNASRPPAEVADHLTRLGIASSAEQVVTSAQVGAQLLTEHLPAGSRVLAIGGEGVAVALAERGLVPVRSAQQRSLGRTDPQIAADVHGILQGFGPDVSWRDLAVASYAVAAGAFWVATNLDRTIPRADGIAPGNGTLVAAVTEATGVTPPSAGKPAADMMRWAAARMQAQRPLAIGDRLDTDIRGARAAGMDSLLVLTGVTGPEDVLGAHPDERPTFVAADLRGLLRPLPRLDQAHTGTAEDDDARIAAAVLRCWSGEQTTAAGVAQLRALLGGAAGR